MPYTACRTQPVLLCATSCALINAVLCGAVWLFHAMLCHAVLCCGVSQIARQGGGLRAYNYPIMVIGPEDSAGWCIVIGLRSNLLANNAQVGWCEHGGRAGSSARMGVGGGGGRCLRRPKCGGWGVGEVSREPGRGGCVAWGHLFEQGVCLSESWSRQQAKRLLYTMYRRRTACCICSDHYR